jgi:hypothetical protein
MALRPFGAENPFRTGSIWEEGLLAYFYAFGIDFRNGPTKMKIVG